MSNDHKSRLGQLLIDKGLISSAQLDSAIKLQLTGNKRLGEILVEQGLVSERQINKALKKQTNLRLTAALIAAAPSSGAVRLPNTPWNPPIAVRATDTMTIGSTGT